MKKINFIVAIAIVFSSFFMYSQDVSGDVVEDVAKTQEVETAAKDSVTEEISTKEEVSTNEEISTGMKYEVNGRIFISDNINIKLIADESAVGVKGLYYSVNNGSYDLYNGEFGLSQEGTNLILYYAEDNIGNLSNVKASEFILDKTAPKVEMRFDRKPVKIGSKVIVGPTYKILMDARDNLSGVRSIEYSDDDGNFIKMSSELDIPYTESKSYSFGYRATDNVGNTSNVNYSDFILDNTAPEVDFVVTPAAFVKDDISYIGSNAKVVITAKDDLTSVKKIYYSVNDGEFLLYNKEAKLPLGSVLLKAKAIDEVGNESEVKEIKLEVIADAPNAELELIEKKVN